MIPVEGIVKPIGTAIAPPGRRHELRRDGEVFVIDNFWAWAHANGKVSINTEPEAVRQFKLDFKDELEDEQRAKQRALNAEVEAAVAARLSEELHQRDERIAKLEAELAARAAKPAVSELTDVEPGKADDAETKKSKK